MSLIDFILNLAGVLLWFNWRSLRFDPIAGRRPATLVGTLKSTHGNSLGGWVFLAAIPLLLFLRAGLYLLIGAPADWVPKLNLGLVVLAFPVDYFFPALLFSLASFLRFCIVVFFWLTVIVVVNQKVAQPDALLRLARLQLGGLGRLPAFVQLLIPVAVTIGLWATLRPVLAQAGIVNPALSTAQVLHQGALLVIALVTSLKFLLPIILLLSMVCTYVYLGNSPVWEFVSTTAANLLALLGFQRLRSSKLDFGPLVGVVLIFLLLHTLPLLALRYGALGWPE